MRETGGGEWGCSDVWTGRMDRLVLVWRRMDPAGLLAGWRRTVWREARTLGVRDESPPQGTLLLIDGNVSPSGVYTIWEFSVLWSLLQRRSAAAEAAWNGCDRLMSKVSL